MTIAFAIGPRTRKVLKYVGFVMLGLVTFVYAVHLTFPYDRVKDRGIEALSSKYDVSVEKVERGWIPFTFTMKNVVLRTRPTKPNEVAKIIKIDSLYVDISVIPFLKKKIEVSLEAKMGPGTITGEVSAQKGRFTATFNSRNLPLSDVPGLASVIGMPMGGRGNVSAKIDLPNNDWRKAFARISIECPGCTVGGEGAFFKPRNTTARNQEFVGQGVPVPLLAITNLSAQWTIDKGKIKTDRFQFTSPHLTLELEFEANVEKELTKSKVEFGCLRYRGTDELKTLDSKFYDALELTGGPLGPDNVRHLKLVGTLGGFKARPSVCGPGTDNDGGAGGRGTDVAGSRSRPTLKDVPAAADPAGPITTPTEAEPALTPDADAVPPQPTDVEPAGAVVDPKAVPPELTIDAGAAAEPAEVAPPVRLEEAAPEGQPEAVDQPGNESASPANGPPPPENE